MCKRLTIRENPTRPCYLNSCAPSIVAGVLHFDHIKIKVSNGVIFDFYYIYVMENIRIQITARNTRCHKIIRKVNVCTLDIVAKTIAAKFLRSCCTCIQGQNVHICVPAICQPGCAGSVEEGAECRDSAWSLDQVFTRLGAHFCPKTGLHCTR